MSYDSSNGQIYERLDIKFSYFYPTFYRSIPNHQLESRIRWKVYVRFGGGSYETNDGNIIRRIVPTLRPNTLTWGYRGNKAFSWMWKIIRHRGIGSFNYRWQKIRQFKRKRVHVILWFFFLIRYNWNYGFLTFYM